MVRSRIPVSTYSVHFSIRCFCSWVTWNSPERLFCRGSGLNSDCLDSFLLAMARPQPTGVVGWVVAAVSDGAVAVSEPVDVPGVVTTSVV